MHNELTKVLPNTQIWQMYFLKELCTFLQMHPGTVPIWECYLSNIVIKTRWFQEYPTFATGFPTHGWTVFILKQRLKSIVQIGGIMRLIMWICGKCSNRRVVCLYWWWIKVDMVSLPHISGSWFQESYAFRKWVGGYKDENPKVTGMNWV